MAVDISKQIPGNGAFFLINQGEPQATILHVLEKIYAPIQILIDNCEPGQYCEYVGQTTYKQPDNFLPFSRGYVVKGRGKSPPETSLTITGGFQT